MEGEITKSGKIRQTEVEIRDEDKIHVNDDHFDTTINKVDSQDSGNSIKYDE